MSISEMLQSKLLNTATQVLDCPTCYLRDTSGTQVCSQASDSKVIEMARKKSCPGSFMHDLRLSHQNH